MIEITQRLRRSDSDVHAQLPLTYELRQRRLLSARLSSGEEIRLNLPRGETLRGGDLLGASDGRVIQVVASPEPIVQATFATASELVRAAYHLGNRHTAVQIGAGFLRIQQNHVLEDLLAGLGATLIRMQASFEPETGAYSERHFHDGAHSSAGATIHEYASDNRADLKLQR